jgi:hypothetical protein
MIVKKVCNEGFYLFRNAPFRAFPHSHKQRIKDNKITKPPTNHLRGLGLVLAWCDAIDVSLRLPEAALVGRYDR